jgi:hypothetical protein
VDALAEVLDCELAFIHLLIITGDHLIKYASYGYPQPLSDNQISITMGRMLQMM